MNYNWYNLCLQDEQGAILTNYKLPSLTTNDHSYVSSGCWEGKLVLYRYSNSLVLYFHSDLWKLLHLQTVSAVLVSTIEKAYSMRTTTKLIKFYGYRNSQVSLQHYYACFTVIEKKSSWFRSLLKQRSK